MTTMENRLRATDIPIIDVLPEDGYEPRRVTFQPPGVRRRGFLRTVALGGMTLGVTVVGWIPPGRRAEATAGTEYGNCNIFRYDGIICTGGPYSANYCGSDKWFKNGCFREPDGYTDCWRPVVRCNGRNAWRWSHNGHTYRCADGEYKCQPCGSWSFRICSARL